MAGLDSAWVRPSLRRAASFTTLRSSTSSASTDNALKFEQSIPSFISFINSTAPVPPLVKAIPPSPGQERRSYSIYDQNTNSVAQNALAIRASTLSISLYLQPNSDSSSTSRLPDRRPKTPPTLDHGAYEHGKCIAQLGPYPRRRASLISQHSPKTRSRGPTPTSFYAEHAPGERSTSSVALDDYRPPPSAYDPIEFSPTADVFGPVSPRSPSPELHDEPAPLFQDPSVQGPLLPHEHVALAKQKRSWSSSQPSPRMKPSSPPSPMSTFQDVRSSSADCANDLISDPADAMEIGYVSDHLASPFRSRPRNRSFSRASPHMLSPISTRSESPIGKSPWRLGELSPVMERSKEGHYGPDIGAFHASPTRTISPVSSPISPAVKETSVLISPATLESTVSPLTSPEAQTTLELDSPTIPVSPLSPKRPGLLNRVRSKRSKPPTSHPETPTPPSSRSASRMRTYSDTSSVLSVSRPGSPYVGPSFPSDIKESYPRPMERLPLNSSAATLASTHTDVLTNTSPRKAFFLRAAPSVLKNRHWRNKSSEDHKAKPPDAISLPLRPQTAQGGETPTPLARHLAPTEAEWMERREGVRSVPDFSQLEETAVRTGSDVTRKTTADADSRVTSPGVVRTASSVSPKGHSGLQISAPVPGSFTVGVPLGEPGAAEKASKEDGRREKQREELKKKIKMVGETGREGVGRGKEGRGGKSVFGPWGRRAKG